MAPRSKKPLTPLEQLFVDYLTLGLKMGCPEAQIMNFWNAGVILQAKQLEFARLARQCDLPDGPKDIMMGGGRGAAKTHGILAQIFCDDCQRMPELKVLVLRNGWFSYRWSQIFEMGRIPAQERVLKARRMADGPTAPFAP